jgi:hypothetical protein
MTSVGTGITHSEDYHGLRQAHFLQIRADPNESNLLPKRYTGFAPSFSQSSYRGMDH